MHRHIAKESHNIDVADAFVVDLRGKAHSLAASGFSGSNRPYISGNVSAFPYRQRCFYFRVEEEKLIVVRLLYGKQDVSPNHFKE